MGVLYIHSLLSPARLSPEMLSCVLKGFIVLYVSAVKRCCHFCRYFLYSERKVTTDFEFRSDVLHLISFYLVFLRELEMQSLFSTAVASIFIYLYCLSSMFNVLSHCHYYRLNQIRHTMRLN